MRKSFKKIIPVVLNFLKEWFVMVCKFTCESGIVFIMIIITFFSLCLVTY